MHLLPPILNVDRGHFLSLAHDENGDDFMKLLEANHIKHFVNDRLLIDVEQLQIHKSDRIGLVGKNGSGKTTLLNILAKAQAPDSGTVATHAICELLPQLKQMDTTTRSGGEVTQDYITKSLAKNPAILFADEPTTNLDTNHIEWLEKKLKNWQGAFVIVSHDRAFLDALCTTIWEIDEAHIKEYKGNYSDYMEQKELAHRQHEMAYEKYEKKKSQLEEALKLKEKKAARATKAPKKVSPSEAKITGAKPYFAKKQKKLNKAAKAIETRLEKLEKVEKVKDVTPVKMNLPNEEAFKNRIILRITDMSGEIGNRILWKPISFHVRGGDKLAIIGSNGCGKTTLVKKMINHDKGITISPTMKIGYFSQNLTILNSEKSILKNVSSTSKQTETFIRIVLARLHFFRDDVYKQVKVLSGGERVKVALAKLFVSDINTLILDEPTNFLDIEAVEALESLLQEYEGTVIFVSHDRRFVENIATRILSFDNNEITIFNGTYADFKRFEPQEKRDSKEDQRLLLETKISEVLSRLSIEPSEELEMEFQKLLKEKRELDQQ